jgi:hypothetical protein
MIKLFRKMGQNLPIENSTGGYFKYAIGEIILVVIGILIAVSINEWRLNKKAEQVLIAYYQGLIFDLEQDGSRLEGLVVVYSKAIDGITAEINKLQLASYNEDSLYSNVPAWMVWAIEFTPNKPTFTEIVSSGKLQLFKNKDLKSQILNVYGNLYPDFGFRQDATNELIRNIRTDLLMETYRWMSINDNDKKPITDVNIENPKVTIKHDWLYDKQSAKFLLFENYLNVTRGGYINLLVLSKNAKATNESLVRAIEQELERLEN